MDVTGGQGRSIGRAGMVAGARCFMIAIAFAAGLFMISTASAQSRPAAQPAARSAAQGAAAALGTATPSPQATDVAARPASCGGADPSSPFSPARNYGAGSFPVSVAVADLTGDGQSDIAALDNTNDSAVSVLLHASGGFAPAVSYSVGGGAANFVAVADLTGDHHTDIVTADYGSNSVSVLRNNGDGTFATARTYSAGISPRAVAVADVNGDGKPDLIVANYNGDGRDATVTVLLNNGAGTFGAPSTYPTGGKSSAYSGTSLAVGDFYGSGRPDVAVTGDGTVRVLRNNGGGDSLFDAGISYSSGDGANYVTAGDVDGDGKPDLVTANGTANSVSVLRNNGDGTFAAATTYASGGSGDYAVALGDVTGSGRLDIVAANYSSDSVSVLRNNGDGTFAAATHDAVGHNPNALALGNVGGSGAAGLGVVTANQNGGDVSVLSPRPAFCAGTATALATENGTATDTATPPPPTPTDTPTDTPTPATPRISAVSFGGSADNPTIIIDGSGFGSAPAAVSGASCGQSGSDYGGSGNLSLVDSSNDPNWFQAGADGNCIGLVDLRYSDTHISYRFGSGYHNSGLPTWNLGAGDSYAVTVKGITFSGKVIYSAVAASAPYNVYLSARQGPPGLDTGFSVVAGQAITFTASGQGHYCNGGCLTGPDGDPNVYSDNPALSGAHTGALIGRIGASGPFFFIGGSATVTALAGGRLYLAYNDCVTRGCYDDNSGGYDVAITPGAAPPAPVTIDPVHGQFYPFGKTLHPHFDASPGATPWFTQTFPTLDFNPADGRATGGDAHVSCTNDLGVDDTTKPFVDVVPQTDGTCLGLPARDAGSGGSNPSPFEAVFTATVRVAAAGDLRFEAYADDSAIVSLGPDIAGNQPTYVSGELTHAPSSGVGPFTGYPVMMAHDDGQETNGNVFTVHFPAAGAYPVEVDYAENGYLYQGLTLDYLDAGGVSHPIPPTSQAAPQPAGVCPGSVWEGVPYLNRYDSYAWQNGVCVKTGYTIHDSTFSTLVLDAGLNYQEANVTDAGVTTMPAGSTLQVSGNASNVFNVIGRLDAKGTATEPITLTSPYGSGYRSQWAGLYFAPGSSGTLEHATVSGAGSQSCPYYCNGGNLVDSRSVHHMAGILVDGANPTIADSTVDSSGGDGLDVVGGGNPSLRGDSFTNNSGNAAHYDLPAAPGLSFVDNGLSASGNRNGYDAIDVEGTLTDTLTAYNPGIPLRADSLTVATGATFAAGGDATGGTTLQLGTVTVSGTMSLDATAGPLDARFTNNATAQLDVYGTLAVTGTTGAPVTLTSPYNHGYHGQWAGIYFAPGSSGALAHTFVSEAGGQSCPYYCNGGNLVDSRGVHHAAGILVDGASPAITNSTIDNNAGDGLDVVGEGNPTLRGDSFTNNSGNAAHYDLPAAPGLSFMDNGLSASGNGHDAIDVEGTLTDTLTAYNPGIPLRADSLAVATGATFAAGGDATGGTTLQLGTVTVSGTMSLDATAGPLDARFTTSTAQLDVYGTLDATGTATRPVTLTSPYGSAYRSQWAGVSFAPGSSGTLEYATVSGAGSQYCYYSCNGGYLMDSQGNHHMAGILVDGAAPVIADSTIDNNAGDGLTVVDGGNPSLRADSFTNNAGNAAYYPLPGAPSLSFVDSGLSASGNGYDSIYLDGTLTGTLEARAPGVPLRADDLTVGVGARLAAGAGTTLQFTRADGQLDVDGTFDATGTTDAPVTLTSRYNQGYRSQWAGVSFAPGSSGTLAHTTVSGAGSQYCYYSCNGGYLVDSQGNHHMADILVDGASPTIADSTIDHSGGDGLTVVDGGNPPLQEDNFTNNGASALYYPLPGAPHMAFVDSGLSASGNANDVIWMNGTLTGTLEARNPGIPLRADNLTVSSEGSLLAAGDAAGGTSLRLSTLTDRGVVSLDGTMGPLDARFTSISGQIDVYGTLAVTGTATSPITLTSQDNQGYRSQWAGIAFLPGSVGALSHAVVSGAGSQYCYYPCNGGYLVDSQGNHHMADILIDGANPTINLSTVDTSGGHDIEVVNSGSPSLRCNTFSAVLGGNDGVSNDSGASGALVDAANNWWGDATGPSGAGLGAGTPASPGVTFTPWLLTPNATLCDALTTGPTGPTDPGANTPELGSGELLITGLAPLALALLLRRRRRARHGLSRGEANA